MPSAILVQKPREEGERSEAGQGIRIVSVESRIDSISLTKAGGDQKAPGGRPFDFDVDMHESVRTEDTLSVKYAFTFGRPSSGQVCKITGGALVRFSQFKPDRDFYSLGNDISNEIAVEIFRRNYEVVYLLHGAMAMDAPSPWVTQDVSLSSRSQSSDAGSENP